MNHQVFIPVTDELIYNNPEMIEGPLIPYSAGMECQDWLSIEINPDESQSIESVERNAKKFRQAKPKLRLAYSS